MFISFILLAFKIIANELLISYLLVPCGIRCASMIWAALSCLRVQRELLDAKFRYHPSLAPIINLHLFRNRVNKEDVEGLDSRLKDLEHKLKATQKESGAAQNKIAVLEKRK